MAKPLGSTGEFFRRRDEWRRHPMLTNNFRHATPGLGIALVAFGIYLAGEAAYNHFRRLTLRPPPITDCWCTIACVVRTPLLPKMKKACKKILSMSTKPATIENRKFLDNYYDLGTMRRRDI